jgi:hypothetical protein
MAWKYRDDEFTQTLSGGIDFASVKGGVRPPASMCHTGGAPAQIAADGVNSTPVITEIYVATIVVPFTVLCTGAAMFNGSDATDSVKVGLFNQAGTLLRATADTQQSGTDAYQSIPWATDGANVAATTIVLPSGTYFLGAIFDGTTTRFNAWGVGAFPTRRVTSAVYATAFNTTSLTITPPTVFTVTDLPPIASLY